MVYITGDTHGDFRRFNALKELVNISGDDVVIVLGDAGLNYSGGETDKRKKDFVSSFPFTTFCIHGNHEKRPFDVDTYKTKLYRGGTVWYEQEYPNILFAKDGEVYDFDGYSCIVIGGAYSVDKAYRLIYGYPWFENEQPSDEIKAYVEARLEEYGNKIDIILSHTCPYKYEPREVFLKGINQSMVDKTTEKWLDVLEEKVDYKKWYCGHYHTVKKIDRLQFMYEDFDTLKAE